MEIIHFSCGFDNYDEKLSANNVVNMVKFALYLYFISPLSSEGRGKILLSSQMNIWCRSHACWAKIGGLMVSIVKFNWIIYQWSLLMISMQSVCPEIIYIIVLKIILVYLVKI